MPFSDDDLKREAKRIGGELWDKTVEEGVDLIYQALRSVRDKALEEARKRMDLSCEDPKCADFCYHIKIICALKSKPGEAKA